MTEDDLQMALFAWAGTMVVKGYDCLRWLYHVPNGGKRDAATASKLARLGVRKGILDIALDVPCRGYHGFRMELKKPGCGGKLSEAQVEYIDFLRANGYYVVVGCDFDELKREILWYLGG